MADPSPIQVIRVHAQFPKVLIPHTELDLSLDNWVWAHCLTFPIDKLNDLLFSSKPYKWIRYATGSVVGARGELSTECALPIAIDYDSPLSSVSIDLYYHTTNEEKLCIFPLDPSLANTRIVTSSQTSTRRDNFRADVEERDGRRCVVTSAPHNQCDAAHLLPHSKGDMYIETFSTHRRRDTSGENDIVQDIDNVRNGLFVNVIIHCILGQHVAFLKTPNFAMDMTDVDLNADGAEERYTTHVFDRSQWPFAIPPGLPIQVPSNMSAWPPATLFDAVYASAVIYHFGVAMDDVLKMWGNVFQPGGPTTAAHTDDKHRRNQADADEENYNEQKPARERRYGRRGMRGRFDGFDALMMLPFMMMPAEKVREYLKGCEEMAAAAVREGLEEKVNSWRGGVFGTGTSSGG
ncbi:hypothetical protein BJV78DRAFT_1249580 [Lactifluus subvellereus]|nr:hypothetical protein BJV78DRAFT_1249580 [Lactifluus subvellereus]